MASIVNGFIIVALTNIKWFGIDEFTQFGSDFSKAYWIVGDDGRKYTISEGMYNKLNTEYNNSVAGHKLNIFFNVKKTARRGHINYMADNITTDSGIIIK